MRDTAETLRAGDEVTIRKVGYGGTGRFLGTTSDGRVRVRVKLGGYSQTSLLLERGDVRKVWQSEKREG